MRELQEYLDELQRVIQKSCQLRYERRGHQHELFQKWWYDLQLLIEDIDNQFQTSFILKFDKSLFLPTEELKRQIDVPNFTHAYDVETQYMAEGFLVGLEHIRNISQSIYDWLTKHGEQQQSLFRILPQDRAVVIQSFRSS